MMWVLSKLFIPLRDLVVAVVILFDCCITYSQINGVEMENARHEAAVALLTGHERFVRLVLQRTITSDQGILW